ncbi:MAG: hypothetical protein OXO53_14170 [Chloroflexota bacterium]|nr:hypothetical protein [Chloroflexota bacterium]
MAAVVLALFYLAQDAAGLPWEWLQRMQAVDGFKYATGACLLIYVGWQWRLFITRVRRKKGSRLMMALHQRSGALAPVLFYLHSVEAGYGYLAVLSWVLLANVVVGAASPAGPLNRGRCYTLSWGTVHVLLAVLTVVLGVFHAYIALYYK